MDIAYQDNGYRFVPWKPALGQVFQQTYALDTETTQIDEEHPWITPAYALGAVFDGQKGYFLERKDVAAFLHIHEHLPLVFPNAPFDLSVLQLLDSAIRVYDLSARRTSSCPQMSM